MSVRVAINGFGRIGRLVLRSIVESGRKDVNVVSINDLGDIELNSHLLKYDSVHGAFPAKINTLNSTMDVGLGPINITNIRDPRELPWKEQDIQIVMECTGLFTKREDAEGHIQAGAKKVLISAPAVGADYTVVYGVNHKGLNLNHKIVSNASCTTNCLAPIAKVINDCIGIENGYMTTVHAFTGDQQTVDSLHKDKRRARAASLSLIPTSTGAAKAVGLVLPELEGKLDGTSIRVPSPNVSLIDFTFTTARKTSVEEINKNIFEASKTSMANIIAVNDEPLVSLDFNHNPASSIFDLTQTQVVGDKFARILSWYDNEWGFSNRMNDVASIMF